jgi:hypothetical protein
MFQVIETEFIITNLFEWKNFGYQLDTYSFDEMRYINALIDYPRYKTTSQRVQKLFMVNPYKLSL